MARFQTKEGEIFEVPDSQMQVPGMAQYFQAQGFTPVSAQGAPIQSQGQPAATGSQSEYQIPLNPLSVIQSGQPTASQGPGQQAQAPQDPLSASLAALKNLRQGSAGQNHPTEMDELINKIESGISLGADKNMLNQAAQEALQAARDQWDNDRLKVLRGEITSNTLHGNFSEAFKNIQQKISLPLQAAQEKKEITTQADTQAQEREALRKEALAKIPGLQKQMGDDLLTQQNYAYSQIAPQIEQRLNAMGILQSGALPEAQQKAFKDLEMARQGRLSDFGTQATQNIELNLPYASLQQSQADKGAALQSGIDLSRAGISRMYQETDMAKAYQQQAELSRQALEEARAARDRANKTAMWQAGIGAAGSIAAAGTTAGIAKFSDSRLKENIVKIGKAGGLYIVQYHWNEKAKEMGAPEGIKTGVIAQDVEKLYPEAVKENNGYKHVIYSELPLEVTKEIERLS